MTIPAESADPTAGLRVVVAEDEALIRLDVVETLTHAGHTVVAEVGDGQAAVAAVREHRPDIVVMDVMMPVMDGIAAAGEIAAERLAPVVMLTAFSQRDLVERASQVGAMAYVVKPFTEKDLLPAMELAVARFDQLRGLEEEVRGLEDRLATRKLMDRAKSLLQAHMDLSEAESFRWIQKTSMDRRLTMREVAQTVVDQIGA